MNSARRLYARSTLWVLALAAAAGCSDGQGTYSGAPARDREASIIPATESPAPPPAKDSLTLALEAARAEALAKAAEFPEIRYHQLHIADRQVLDSVRKAFRRGEGTRVAHRALITLNRKETGYIRVGDTIVVPDTIVEDLRAYSVFPQRYPGADTIPKLIMVSNAMQAYACYEFGQLVRFAAANTGTESKATFPGRYALNWKARLRISSLNENWKLPFTWNFHKWAGNAFHQFEMPGRPVSHSCIRQFRDDAEWLFEWGEAWKVDASGRPMHMSGTPVIIIDMFDYSRKKGGPWLELASNREGILELPSDPMGVEEALIPISQVPHSVRGGLPNRNRYKFAEDTLRARGVIREEARLSPSIDYNRRRAARRAVRSPSPPASVQVGTTTPPPESVAEPTPPSNESAPN
jgi:hypothetical protein